MSVMDRDDYIISKDKIIDWFKEDRNSTCLNDNNFNILYNYWNNDFLPLLDTYDLTEILFNGGINPLEHMSETVYGMFNLRYQETSIKIPEGVELLAFSTFLNCPRLTTIHLPSTVKYIKRDFIKNCPNLKDIYYDGDAQDWQRVTIDLPNDALQLAKMHFNK